MKFIVALYVIPTGSMQPTLHGKTDYPHELGDKVLVNKFIYRFQDPERWDVIVFDYPFNTIMCNHCGQDVNRQFPKHEPKIIPPDEKCMNFQCVGKERDLDFIDKEYIKRCTAIPGDELTIKDGNVVLRTKEGGWAPSVKTDEAQNALWVDIFDSSNEVSMSVKGNMWRSIQPNDALAKWSLNRPLVLEKGTPSTLLFANPKALKGYGDKGVNGGKSPIIAPPVGDVLLDLQLESFPSSGTLTLEVDRNRLAHRMVVNFDSGTWELSVGDTKLGDGKLPKNPKLAFARLDGRLEVHLDDERVGFDFTQGELDATETIVPKIRWNGGSRLTVNKLRVARDIFYVLDPESEHLTGPDKSYTVREGEYFAMGDNSYFSSDSRTWGPVPEEELIGKALVVILPFKRIKFIR